MYPYLCGVSIIIINPLYTYLIFLKVFSHILIRDEAHHFLMR